MVQSSEGQQVVFETTETGSHVPLFNSSGAVPSKKLDSRRVHPSIAGIVRVEKSPCWPFYGLNSASLRWVSRHLSERVRKLILGGFSQSGGFGEGVVSSECKEQSQHSAQQPARKPSASGASARSVEVGGRGGLTGGRALGSAGAERKSSGGSGAERSPSAGWREVAAACHATEGQSHE